MLRAAGTIVGFFSLLFFAQSAVACTAQAPCTASDKIITFYVPHNAPNCRSSMEGCVETSRPGLDGQRVPRSLDDVRAGRSKFVTLASDSSNYGKYFNIGSVTYLSAQDKQKHTVPNVIGYVHDTGGAFKGKPQKIDVNTTICQNCTDAQASAMAAGNNVSLAPSSQGLVDNNPGAANNGYGNALTGSNQAGAGTAPPPASNASGTTPGPSAGGGAPPGLQNPPLNTHPTGIQNPQTAKDGKDKPVTPADETPDPDTQTKLELTCEDQIVTWACGAGADSSRAVSKPGDVRFRSQGKTVGSVTVRPRRKTMYTIQCLQKHKLLEFASCALAPAAKGETAAPARLSISVDRQEVRRGEHVTVAWSASRVKSCEVSGDGVSENGRSGVADTDALLHRGVVQIVLTCTTDTGTVVRDSASITVR
jgi:hypothetical protein